MLNLIVDCYLGTSVYIYYYTYTWLALTILLLECDSLEASSNLLCICEVVVTILSDTVINS